MKRFFLVGLLWMALAAVGCRDSRPFAVEDFTVERYTPRYASGFDIRSREGSASSLVTVRNPWQGGSGEVQYLYVVRDGEPVPAGFPGQVVEAPVRRGVCMSSSHVAMFDLLGEVERIVGVSGIDYIANDYVAAHKLCGEVRDVGYDSNLNFELLVAMRVDLVLLYGVAGEDTAVTNKLRELGIPYIYIGDYVEESPLGKAEWVMVIAELTDRMEQGRSLFDATCARYEALRDGVKPGPRPRVMLNTPYRDTWYLPSADSYMVRLIEDAGGAYVCPEARGNASHAVEIEQAYLLTNSADYWFNTGAANSLQELVRQNPRFASVPAVRNGRVFNNNRRQTPAGGSDFWESGVVHPDRVLADLIRIFEGRSDSLWYYKKLE